MDKKQPAAYINFELYEDAVNQLGLAKVKLPSIMYQFISTSGAGLMGNLDVPLIGMIEAMEAEIDFQSPTGSAVNLMTPEKHLLDLRIAEEYWDVGQAEAGVWADKYVMLVMPKGHDPGTIAPAASADTNNKYAVYYFAGYRDGVKLFEVDKRSMKCIINGKDYMEPVRKALGW